MRIRIVKWGIALCVLLFFAGSGFVGSQRVATAAEGDKPASDKAVLPGEIRVYEIHKKVKDFPEKEDLSTPEGSYAAIHRAYTAEGDGAWKRLTAPELAERIPEAEKKPLPKEAAERFLEAEILEVHVWSGVHAEVLARMLDRQGRISIDLRGLLLVEGRWLNNGNEMSDSLENARKTVAQRIASDAAKKMRDNRPPVADPEAHQKTFVDFLKKEAKDPQEFVLEAIEKHRLVIMGEIHHRPRYWAFDAELVRSPEFAKRVGVIYMELPANDQPLIDRFLAADKYNPKPVIEMLRDMLWMGWPDQPMLDFFRTVWEVNQKLSAKERLRIMLVDMERPWDVIQKREDWQKYDVDRDQFMAKNIVSDLKEHDADARHALFIVGYAHAMVNLTWAGGEPMKSAGWHLREELGEKNVFAIFPHGPVITNMGSVGGRLALGLFETAFAEMGNKPMAFPLDRGPFGELLFDADPERLTADPFSKGYQAFLNLGPFEDEVFSPLIPGFYTDEFVKELDRRHRMMEGKGLIEAGMVDRLTGAAFVGWMSNSWGQPRRDWSAGHVGPLDAWKYGSHYQDALRKRLPSTPAKTGKVLDLYGFGHGRKSMLNLSTGEAIVPDPQRFHGDNPEGIAWLREKGIDMIAYAKTDSGDQALVGYAMVAAKIDNDKFDALDLVEAKRILEKAAKNMNRGPATMLSIKAGLPVTYAFRTRGGSFGVLQIEDARLSETPPVFRLRFRLFPKP